MGVREKKAKVGAQLYAVRIGDAPIGSELTRSGYMRGAVSELGESSAKEAIFIVRATLIPGP